MGSGGKFRLCQAGGFSAGLIEEVGKPEVLALYLMLFLSGVAVVAVKQNKVEHINKHVFSSLISGMFAIERTCFACKQNLFKISVAFAGCRHATQRPKLSN